MFDLHLNRNAIANNPLSLELVQKLNMACESWRSTENLYKRWVTIFLCVPNAIAAPFLTWTQLSVFLLFLLIAYMAFVFLLPNYLNKIQKVSLMISGEQFANPNNLNLLKPIDGIDTLQGHTDEAKRFLGELKAIRRPVNALDLDIFNYLNFEAR